MERDYGSRKFITTMTGMGLGFVAVMAGALMEPPEGYWTSLPALFVLFAAGIAAYNWANLRTAQNGSAPR